MNGRYFAGRELRCFYWDGKTDYRVRRRLRIMVFNNCNREQERLWKMNKRDWMSLVNGLKVRTRMSLSLRKNKIRTNFITASEPSIHKE